MSFYIRPSSLSQSRAKSGMQQNGQWSYRCRTSFGKLSAAATGFGARRDMIRAPMAAPAARPPISSLLSSISTKSTLCYR